MRSSLLYLAASLAACAISSSAHLTFDKRADPDPASDALKQLAQGNAQFISDIKASSNPNLLVELVEKGQKPTSALLGCSDSRVSEGTVFDVPPGTIFTHRNIANQLPRTDSSTNAFASYGISVLGIQHLIIMGHYGCGGVQAAMMPRPNNTVDAATAAVQDWVDSIRDLYETSPHPAIVASRSAPLTTAPAYDDPAFRALVEENVKRQAKSASTHPAIVNHYHALATGGTAAAHRKRADPSGTPLVPVYVHSWVYDLRTGAIKDLEYSFGPPGHTIPTLSAHQST